jgi:hypothetical protein
MKMPRRRLIAISGLFFLSLAVGFVVYVVRDLGTPKDAGRMDPLFVFRQVVCDPIPDSVTDIIASGEFSFGGDSIKLECRISPNDFEDLIRLAGFSPVRLDGVGDPFEELRARMPSAELYRSGSAGAGGRRDVYMLAPASHDRLFISHLSP